MSDIMERLLREAADEIKRLRGLLANSEMTVAEVMADNERLHAEVRRLRDKSDYEVVEQKREIERLRDLLHRWHVCYSHDEESDLAKETRAALEGKP